MRGSASARSQGALHFPPKLCARPAGPLPSQHHLLSACRALTVRPCDDLSGRQLGPNRSCCVQAKALFCALSAVHAKLAKHHLNAALACRRWAGSSLCAPPPAGHQLPIRQLGKLYDVPHAQLVQPLDGLGALQQVHAALVIDPEAEPAQGGGGRGLA